VPHPAPMGTRAGVGREAVTRRRMEYPRAMKRRFLVLPALSLALLGAPACGGSTPPATETSAARRPSDAYADYIAAISNASTLREVLPLVSAAARKRLATDLETLKAKAPAGRLKIIDEQLQGERATVTVSATLQDQTGKERPATGTVVLVREDGGWKVDQESWKPSDR
jgi:hypothetical protein